MAEYKGTVELIAGITPKNNGSFPLVGAHDVQIDNLGTRLDEALSASGQTSEALKELLEDRTEYSSTDITALNFRKGFAVNSFGRYATSHPEAIAGYSNDDTPYVYAGTTFIVNSGYKLSVSLWSQPITGSISADYQLYLERDVENGTITVNQDGYLRNYGRGLCNFGN